MSERTDNYRMRREARQKEKSDALFIVYKMMGPDRSMTKLLEICSMAGLKVGETTLKTYSVKFEWQRRLLEQQRTDNEKRELEAGKMVDDMNRQDAGIAQGMKGLVIGGLRFYQDTMKKQAEARKAAGQSGDSMLPMGLQEMANLARTAQQIERLARGQATSRTEVWVDIASTVVREFVLIFTTVNKFESVEEREREFLRLGDEMMTRYYNDAVKTRLALAPHDS